ncbi:NYN domain-containing protein [Microbacterium algeriense]|jgi:uncharacterized LabA/DUF88 family protein|uniref:NYN domain-containing protein n=1 Tax=Microbacterium algeriense TaxID=2615184 RepID=A0ABQ6VAQ7_9MICO|nr:NYN domain-containing protein [Microbacterium algeriense]KAB1867353.1 NYN domain-containing protein [Microbacterium algeriense]
MTTPTALIVMDYQNIHLTGRDRFAPEGLATHECLVHPAHFAEQVLHARHVRTGVKLELAGVRVFRGAPSQKENARMYAYSQAHKSEWTRNRLVSVHYRTLRYYWENNIRVAQEKGIDVLVALELARAAMDKEADVVILASHDTDLEPALEAAQRWSSTIIETAGWAKERILRPTPRVSHTALDGAAFVKSRDRKDYDKR